MPPYLHPEAPPSFACILFVRLTAPLSGFLRALEFYDGILFLTTNRVGAFDDAILSRVHIQLFYPNLDASQRQKLWMTFLTKLEADRPSIQVKYAVKEYLRSSEMREFEMNGREIRNGESKTTSPLLPRKYKNKEMA